MYKLELKISEIPAALNVTLRAGRWGNQRKNQEWDHLVWAYVQGKKPRAPLGCASIHLVRHSYRMLDFDGLVGSMKPVVDALVTARVLKDDSWGVLAKWDVDQVFRPKSEGPLLEILVEELLRIES